jgi:hypothetical protein
VSPTEILPLLVVTVLVLSASGSVPDSMEVVFGGDQDLSDLEEAVAVGGGTATLPAEAAATGDVFVIGGTVHLQGTLDGDVQVFAGNLTVTDGAVIRGELRTVAGEVDVAPGATVARRTALDVTPTPQSPLERVGFLAMQILVLGTVAAVLTRRAPGLLRNVGETATGHPLVSGVVGSLAALTLLVLFVYMAFTLVLLPVSILGLVGEVLVVIYSYVVYGALLGRALPLERPAVAAFAGVGVFMVAMELLGTVPLVGILVQLGLLAVGFGAVLLSYFGLQVFEPARIPG